MADFRDLLIVILMFINLMLLASSRIRYCIKIVAFQGLIVGLIPLIAAEHSIGVGAVLTALCVIAVKCVLLPILLQRSQIIADVRREIDPFIGYTASTLIGIAALVISFWISTRLPQMEKQVSHIAAPAAIFTILTGLFIIMSRKVALTQVLGYLVFENGIYLFGGAMLLENGFIIELGILLDIFVLVFVMGIAVFHISQEFNHIDTDRLSQLGDWNAELPEEIKK